MAEEKKLYPMVIIPQEVENIKGVSYKIADLGYVDSLVSNGWLGGNSMSELMETYLDRVVGDDAFDWYGTQFPITIKTLDIKEDTPLMMNIGDEEAAQRYDAFGKTALWYVSGIDPNAKLYMGFSEAVSPAEFYQRCLIGDVKSLLNEVQPNVGDAFLIPPGLVYAADAGLKIIEVSEASDLTLNLANMAEKGTTKDLEDAFDLINLNAYDRSLYVDLRSQEETKQNKASIDEVVSVPQFKVNRITLNSPISSSSNGTASFVVYYCISGSASVNAPETYQLTSGHAMLIPAELADYVMVPLETGTVLLEVIFEKQPQIDSYTGDKAD